MVENKKYYWLKLKNDFFKSLEVKRLRKIAGGDTYTLIYIELMLLSINNAGIIEFKGFDPSLAHQLALELDEDPDNIQVTLSYLEKNDLAQWITEKELYLTRVPEIVGKESQSAERVRLFRERKNKEALHCNGEVLHCNAKMLHCNENVTLEKEKEKEIDIKENIKEKKSTGEEKPKRQNVDDLKPEGVSKQTWDYFKNLRKVKTATITPILIERFLLQCEKANIDPETGMKWWVEKGFRGFKAQWYLNDQEDKPSNGRMKPREKKQEDKNYDVNEWY